MCGIAGTFGSCDPDPTQWLPFLGHRGPDGEGTWTSPSESASLAHTRLAVLDLSDAGAQPMSNQQRNCHLVFNGEIYNYQELKKEIEPVGRPFRGNSDTEVLLSMLSHSAVKDVLPHLAGMFAFAFWDEGSKRGILARDPFGIKPLYYMVTSDGNLHFASEVKALRLLVASDKSVSKLAKREYLKWGSVPEPLTLFNDIQSLSAGQFLEWEAGVITIRTFASVQFPQISNDGTDPVQVAREAIKESVHRHLISDVPVGLFLSGGIDSSALLALTRKALGPQADIRTFSIGFENADYDESSVARKTAAHFDANHSEWLMTSLEGMGEIAGYMDHMDQPTIDGFNTWCVSKFAGKNGVKVVLSGLGGDELFAGYGSFKNLPKFINLYSRLGPLRKPVASLFSMAGEGSKWNRLSGFLKSNGQWLDAFHAQRGIFMNDEVLQLVDGVDLEIEGRSNNDFNSEEPLDSVSLLELKQYMRNQLLRDSDVFSMAHGLELRVPFVDFRLFQSISAIPASIRLRQGKQLLLEAVPEIPQWVRERPKQGFRFPFDDWVTEVLGERLDRVERESPVHLSTWFRKWALVALENTS